MGFNVTMVDPTYTGTTLVPRGVYKLEILNSEEKATSKGDGMYVELVISVVEPAECRGQFYEIVNTQNPNAKAVEIGQRTLAAIGNAVGVLEGEFSDLHHKPFVAEVKVEASTNPKYPGDKNRLGRVYWEEGSEPKQLGPSGPPAASTAAAPARPAVVTSNPAPKPAAARPWATKR
jgi:hypothetical protein